MSKKFLSPIKLAQGTSTPSTGSSGELFYNTTDKKIYTHNGTAWVAAGGGVTNSDTAPTSPSNGDAWFNTNEGRLFVYYADGTSNQWVEATPTPVSSENYQMPAGSIMAWGGATAPANWLLCDGAAVSRTTYASLFAAIGTTYGAGNGTTTFNVPDLKGRVLVGLDSSQTEFNTLGETGGAKTHTLTQAEMPSHTHIQNSHNHTQNAHSHTQDAHAHEVWVNSFAGDRRIAMGPLGSDGDKYSIGDSGNDASTNTALLYAKAVTATNQATTATNNATTATNQNTGGGGAHNNLQPYIVLNYIIKFSAGETPGDSQLAVRVGTLETQNNATPLSPNYAINGALDFWQRGTSATLGGNSNGFPSADRMRVISSGASSPAITLARSTDVPSGVGAQYSAAMSWSSNISAGDVMIHHGIENGKYLFAGKTVTVSFYAKAATAIQAKFDFDQDYGETFFNLTTSWARYSYTITLPSNYATSRPATAAANDNTELRFIRFTSISSASNTIYFTGLQVEEGANVTPFRRNSPTLQAEFASCQRYFQIWGNSGWTYEQIGQGQVISSTVTRVRVDFVTSMRIPPTAPGYTAVGDFNMEMAGAAFAGAVSVIDNWSSTTSSCTFNATHPSNANWTNGKMCGFVTNNTTNARFYVSAEI